MIRSIRLTNWRSHADSRLEFRKGTNLLVGIMGAGKSSILEGISFCLFGTFPALERRKLKQDDIVRLSEARAGATMEFGWGGSSYRVERTIERSKKGTSSQAEIYKDGALVEHGPAAVNSYIEQLTGVDYDLFTRAIYSEQNNIDHFLNLDPRRRKEELDRLLGLDKFELARSNIVSVINRVRSKRETIEERLDRGRISELEKARSERESQAAAAESALKAVAESAARLSADYAATSSRFDSMRKAREEHERLRKEELRLAALSESLGRELAGKEADEAMMGALERKAAETAAERARLQGLGRSLEEKASARSREIGSLEAAMKAAKDASTRLSALEAERKTLLGGLTPESLQQKQKEAEHAALGREAERQALERQAAETSQSMHSLRSGLSRCPVCDAELTESGITHVKEEKEAAIRKARARAAELSSLAESARKDSEALLSRLRKASLLGERISSLAGESASAPDLPARKAALEAELAAVHSERKSLSERLEASAAECERLRNEAASLKALCAKKKELDAASARLAELRSRLSALGFSEADFEAVRSGAERMRIESERLSSQRKEAEATLKMCRELLKSMRDELAALRAAESDIRSLYSLEEQLSLYRNALLDTQVSLRSGLSEAINSAMNEIWGIFYPYKNYRGLRLSVSDKDYVFEVDDGNGWKGLETIASGGERASAALALRVALAMILTPKLSWLILDEPTHNLDSEAVELLSSALQFKVPQVVMQTFVITHDEAFMGSDFAASYRLSRDKNRNGETKVEPM